MADIVALTGIIVLGLVVGVVAIVGIVFGVPVRSKATRDGFELRVEARHKAEPPSPRRAKTPKAESDPPHSTAASAASKPPKADSTRVA